MKQILQQLRTGEIELAELPSPTARPGCLLIETSRSLISPGTEKMLLEFGRASWIQRARSQPDRVRQVVSKARRDGLAPVIEAVRGRLEEPIALGYSNVGRVIELGAGVQGFAVGDRVVSNGPHAEVVCVPATLAALVPGAVDDEAASFAVLGAIALNGTRLLEPTLGETFAVIGLGLLGQLAVQLLRAQGCKVIAIDIDRGRCELARTFGAEAVCVAEGEDPVRTARERTRSHGVDGVVITASAQGDALVHQAAAMCRKRGRIVLVGVVDLKLQRSDFYEKEISFRVACSYGPGRYDPAYERKAQDYPLAHVRWTAARNFEAILDFLADKRVDVAPLISDRVAHGEATRAYEGLLGGSAGLGVVLCYPGGVDFGEGGRSVAVAALGEVERASLGGRARVGMIGAGGFARQVLLPAIQSAGAPIVSIASAGGVSGLQAARRFAAREATTDVRRVLSDAEVDVVFIATRHDTHPGLVAEALAAGKHVFVEKPLAIDEAGLSAVCRARAEFAGPQLMVGFNRRFAPHAVEAKRLLRDRTAPVSIRISVNAGTLPEDHWANSAAEGGGRIIGEACHFVDLARFLAGCPITSVHAVGLAATPRPTGPCETMAITLAFADGSVASIDYFANGPSELPKERVEVYSSGRGLVIDNWRRMRVHGWRAKHSILGAPWSTRQDKGHGGEVEAFLRLVEKGGAPLIPFAELVEVARACFAAVRSAEEECRVRLDRVAPAWNDATSVWENRAIAS